MTHLVLPDSVDVRLITWNGNVESPKEIPYIGPPIVFGIQTFARHKNDYHLGPFFSLGDRVTITRDRLKLLVQLHLDFGLMDYSDIGSSFSLVELAHWSSDDVTRAVQARQQELKRGEFFSARDSELWGSPRVLIDQLRKSASARMRPATKVGGLIIRDEWDGSRKSYSYEYRVPADTGSR